MKAEIDEKGHLIISAETALESYALAQWMDDYWQQKEKGSQGKSVLQINTIWRTDDNPQ